MQNTHRPRNPATKTVDLLALHQPRQSKNLSTLLPLRLVAMLFLLAFNVIPLANAQDTPPVASAKKESDDARASHQQRNEFGAWAGYSPFSFKLKGVSEDRQLFLLNLQYARTLFVTRPLTFKYTAELVPVALEIQPAQVYIIGGNPVLNPSGTIYGAGASPVGFQGNFGRKSIQPFANGSVGFLYFTRQVPIVESSQFNYTVSIGFGAQFFRASGRTFTLGWKYHHLSNNYQATLNPGIDSGLFYVGFSIFPKGQ